MKIINKFIRLSLIVLVVFIFTSSSTVFVQNIENTSINKTTDLSTMAMRIMETESSLQFEVLDNEQETSEETTDDTEEYELPIFTGDASSYTILATLTGELTSYVYNCEACSGRLGCLSSLDLSDGTDTYVDDEFGEVSIVASSSNLACGSIISMSTSLSDEPMYAIVLDRGVTGNDIDILVADLDYAYQIGRRDVTYDVLRSGW